MVYEGVTVMAVCTGKYRKLKSSLLPGDIKFDFSPVKFADCPRLIDLPDKCLFDELALSLANDVITNTRVANIKTLFVKLF